MGLLVGTGLLLSVRCGFPQIRELRGTARAVRASLAGGKGGRGPSPFQATCTALAASVGTGNVAGVAGAIALGGPGAVFWMWISALLGACTKACEIALAVKYRRRDRDGGWRGGPMYYIRDGAKAPVLAGLYALCGSLAAFGMGNVTQVNTICRSVCGAVSGAFFLSVRQQTAVCLGASGLCAAVSAAVLLGGARRLGEVTGRMVPAMAGLYILAAAGVICFHAGKVPHVLLSIVRGAFSPASVVGGAAGIGLKQAVICGVGRGVFSNEAGLGSASIAHASAEARSPREQGLMGVFEVFVDTLLICTLTALTILTGTDSVPYGHEAGAELTARGLSSVLGGAASGFTAVILCLFALSSVLAWGMYGRQCAEYLLGAQAGKPYLALFCGVCVLGGVLRPEAAWQLSDLLNGLMALPNLTGLLLLSRECAEIWKRT